MKISVVPLKGSSLELSSRRKDVVPTATMRPPRCRAAFSRATVSAETSPHSACILWSRVSSAFTGKKVPAPTCKVTNSLVYSNSFQLLHKIRREVQPAVGAATAPGCWANMVW